MFYSACHMSFLGHEQVRYLLMSFCRLVNYFMNGCSGISDERANWEKCPIFG